MKFVVVSDLHITDKNDPGFLKLVSFLKSEVCRTSEVLFLLGDIFDLMAGYHKEYLVEYDDFFEQVRVLLKNGTRVEYFEGNHDMHLAKIFKKAESSLSAKDLKVKVHRKGMVTKLNGKKVYLSHGDDIRSDELTYKLYKGFISSTPLKFVADYLMPFRLLNYLSLKAIMRSRERHKETPSELILENIKHKFRVGMESKWSKVGFDIAIIGHSHVPDVYSSSKGFVYYNISNYDGEIYYFDSELNRVVKFENL